MSGFLRAQRNPGMRATDPGLRCAASRLQGRGRLLKFLGEAPLADRPLSLTLSS